MPVPGRKLRVVAVAPAEPLAVMGSPLPPVIDAQPVALPFARIPVGALPVVQSDGAEARAVAVAALPVVFWFHVGAPVAFVRLIAEGVPSAGVTRVGEVASTTFPLPVVDTPPNAPELLT